MKWKTEYTVLSIIAGLVITIIVMAVVWSKHECAEPTKPQLDEIYNENVKTINDAETNEDFDSLSTEYFGFKPTRRGN